MLPSSRTTRLFVALIAALVFTSATVYGQDGEGPRAVLVDQVVPGGGVPVLPPNRIEYFSASYDAGGATVRLYLIASDGTVPGQWETYPCSLRTVFRLTNARSSSEIVLRFSVGGFGTVILRGPASYGGWCLFVDRFSRDFLFFAEALGTEPMPPFPAVIDLS